MAGQEIKNILKKLIPLKLLNIYRTFNFYDRRVYVLENETKNRWLLERLPRIKEQKEILKINEFKIYSQNGDDGIIDYIFSKIGTTNKKFVEFGIEDGRECNTANLSINFGWKGLLIEGDKANFLKAKEFYREKPVRIVNAFVTKDSINQILSDNGMTGEIDLLSIDIDGNDYWVWKEISVIKPRVVVIEYNSAFKNRMITIKYTPNFKAHQSGLYWGASLDALTKLGKQKGYILVGCCSDGVNAFFVRKDAVKKSLKELPPEEAYYPHGDELVKFKKIEHLNFERV